MLFYELSNATGGDNKKFAFASGYGPLASGMPWLHPKALDAMIAFWKVNPSGPGLLIAPGGKVWPDFLGNGHPEPMFFVSERVVKSLRAIGAPIGRVTEIPLAEVKSQVLKASSPHKYFVVETLPGIEVDFRASNFPIDSEGKPIPGLPWPMRYKVREDSWKGSNLFDYSNFGQGPYVTMLCTEKIKDLARKEKWTNVRFKPVDVI